MRRGERGVEEDGEKTRIDFSCNLSLPYHVLHCRLAQKENKIKSWTFIPTFFFQVICKLSTNAFCLKLINTKQWKILSKRPARAPLLWQGKVLGFVISWPTISLRKQRWNGEQTYYPTPSLTPFTQPAVGFTGFLS